MIDILQIIGKSFAMADQVGRPLNGDQADVIIWLNRSWPRMGIVFEGEALVLDYRTFMSFRVRSGNLGYSKDLRFMKSPHQLDKSYLTEYFFKNSDNPYALYNVIKAIESGRPTKDLTQFPPLVIMPRNEEDHRAAIERLLKKAEPGDVVFSSIQRDPLSSLIRKEDQGQFSHCAPYLGNGEVMDIGPGGVVLNSVRDYPLNMRLALYRLRDPLSEEQKRDMVSFAKQQVEKGLKYNYWGIIKLFLRKKYRIPMPNTAPSVSDLLYTNKFCLVDFI